MKLPTYSFNYPDNRDTDKRMLGFMAQDIQPYFPELVYMRYNRELTKPLPTLNYRGIGIIAIKDVEELKLSIQKQQEQIDLQDQKIDLLMNRIEALEKK
jgi:hypothetical protein